MQIVWWTPLASAAGLDGSGLPVRSIAVVDVRDGQPLPGRTPADLLSQLAFRVCGPLRLDRVHLVLDFHGLRGQPAATRGVTARRNGIAEPTLRRWVQAVEKAGASLPLTTELCGEVARRSRPGEDHLARCRVASTLGLGEPLPPVARAVPELRPSARDIAAARTAIRVLGAISPLSLGDLVDSVRRSRRFRERGSVGPEDLAAALVHLGVTVTSQGLWQRPETGVSDRYRVIAEALQGRTWSRSSVIEILVRAGYRESSAGGRILSVHPMLRRIGPDQYALVGDRRPDSR